MLKKLKNSNSLLVIVLLMLLVSCDSNGVFDRYISLNDASWKANEKISFDFTINDTLAKHNLFIQLRNNSKYGFSNLFLITQCNFPDGQRIIDTLEYDMADNTGKFLGAGFTEVKENKLFYKENITFPIRGEYTFSVSQAMRKSDAIQGIESLDGITDVGFRIEKIE